MPDPTIQIHINSLVGLATELPLVGINIVDEKGVSFSIQIDALEAMRQANILQEAAASAIADAFIFAFLREKIRITNAQAAMIMNEFREFRADLEKKFAEDNET